MCAITGQWGKPTRQTLGRIPIRRTPVTTHRNNDIKTGDHEKSKSVKSSFTNTQSVNVRSRVSAVFAVTCARALTASFNTHRYGMVHNRYDYEYHACYMYKQRRSHSLTLRESAMLRTTRVGTLIVTTIYD